MAFVTLGKPLPWPATLMRANSGPSLTTAATLSAAAHHYSMVFCSRHTMTVTHIGYKSGANALSPTVDLRLESVSETDRNPTTPSVGTGLPTGTLLGATNNAHYVTAGLTNAAQWVSGALLEPATINPGDYFSIRVRLTGFSAGQSTIVQHISGVQSGPTTVFPFRLVNTSGSDTKSTMDGALPSLAIGTSGTTWLPISGTLPYASLTTINSGFTLTGNQKKGMLFRMPFGCRCIGLRHYSGNPTAEFKVAMYAGTSTATELASGYVPLSTTISNGGHIEAYFDTPITLDADNFYRAVIVPTTSTTCGIIAIGLPNANYFDAYPGGANTFYTTWTDPGPWDDVAGILGVPIMDILIDQIDDGTGGVGGGGFAGIIG